MLEELSRGQQDNDELSEKKIAAEIDVAMGVIAELQKAGAPPREALQELGHIDAQGKPAKHFSPATFTKFINGLRAKGIAGLEGLTAAAPETKQEPTTEPEPTPSPETAERKEGAKPKRRNFLGYRMEQGESGFVLHEDYQEWDRKDEQYKDKTLPTAITFTESLAAKLNADPSAREEVANIADGVRREIDDSKITIYFDKPKNEPNALYPKWKYSLNGKEVYDLIPTEEIPEITALVRTNAKYFETPEWKKWYGKQLQQKREGVISAELARRFPDAAKPVEAQASPAEEQAAQASIALEIKNKISVDAKTLRPLYEQPQDKDIDGLVQLFKDIAGGYGSRLLHAKKGSSVPGLPAEAIDATVREVLLEAFEGNDAVTKEITRLMPEPAAPKAAEGVIELTEKEITPEPAAAKASPENEVIALTEADILEPSEAAYLELRKDMDEKKGVGTYRVLLKQRQKLGIVDKDAAERLLSDIEFGKAGEASESYEPKDVERTPEAAAFLKEHPLLNRRNIQMLRDGRIIVHADRVRPEESLRRAFDRMAQDAMARRGIKDDAAMQDRIASYLERIVTGKNENKAVTERFAATVASFDASAGEMTIPAFNALDAVIGKLIEKIESVPRTDEKKE